MPQLSNRTCVGGNADGLRLTIRTYSGNAKRWKKYLEEIWGILKATLGYEIPKTSPVPGESETGKHTG